MESESESETSKKYVDFCLLKQKMNIKGVMVCFSTSMA